MINNATVAQATAVVGYDIVQGVKWRRENYNRRAVGVGLAGSAVVGDCNAEMFVNGLKVGEFRNLVLGWPSKDYILPCNIPVPRDSLIEMKMTIQPTTNPINLIAIFVP